MAADNLTGQYISSTFQRVLQLSDNSSNVLNGTGSVVTTLPITASYASYVNTLNQTVTVNGSLRNGSSIDTIGTYSHAEGYNTKAIGDSSHAEGSDTRTGTTKAYYAEPVSNGVAILSGSYGDKTSYFLPNGDLFLYDEPFNGNYNRAIFKISQSYYTTPNTVVELYDTSVTTAVAYVGNLTANPLVWDGDQIIPADKSHTEGYQTITLNNYSHAEGNNTVAIGLYSHVEGNWTVSSGSYQHVQGQYNKMSPVEGAFIVGNGANNSSRSNLIHAGGTSVDISGSLTVSGSLTLNNVAGDLRPYKVYSALISQAGSTAPTVTVLENTLGVVPTFEYQGVGSYLIRTAGVNTFTAGKTFMYIANSRVSTTTYINSMTYVDEPRMGVNCVDTNDNPSNDGLSNTPFEIRIYN